ncbi:MAG: hypothetical protein QM770_12125 [Tepidisphaeraceae bacterium]
MAATACACAATAQNEILGNVIGVGVNPIFDVGNTYGVNLDGAYHTNIKWNTIGRCAIAISIDANDTTVYGNDIGTNSAGANIGNGAGVIINGDWNAIQANTITNCTNNGIDVPSGKNNSFYGARSFNNFQAIRVTSTANDGFTRPAVTSISQNPSTGEYSVSVTTGVLPVGDYYLSYYQSDSPGQAASGDLQHFIRAVSHHVYVENQQYFNDTFEADKIEDGQYLTVMITEFYSNNGINEMGSSTEPSAAKKVVALPGVKDSSFEYETGHSWRFQFTSDVSASLSAGDLSLRNADTNALYSATSVTWDAVTKTARFARSTPLPDGRYVAAIKTGAVSNGVGANVLNYPMNFNFLRGDFNHDSVVNFTDLLVLASNYGKTGKTVSTGDTNYDGTVNFVDLLALAQRYGTNVFGAATITSDDESAATNEPNSVLA